MGATGMFANSKKLPHEPIALSTILIVESALIAAWARLKASPFREGIFLQKENDITRALNEILSNEIFGNHKGFDEKLFDLPVWEYNVNNYGGRGRDKRPDFCIHLHNRNPYLRTQDGIFIECKPVDKSHPVASHYCEKGITRFLNAEYAWAMREALMVGYITGNYTIQPKLLNAINKGKYNNKCEDQSLCEKSKNTSFSERIYITKHERNFCYVETKEKAPSITLRHLWLKCD